MRIDGNPNFQAVTAYQQARQQAPSSNKASGTENTRDEVNISAEAKSLLKQHVVRDVTSPERSERINQLRKAVQNGTYHVESERVAAKMIQFWQWK